MRYIYEDNRIYMNDEKEDLVAEVTFPEIEKGRFVINRTFVDDSLRGQGIAGELVRRAVEKIESNNGIVEATCSYAVAWLNKNRTDSN